MSTHLDSSIQSLIVSSAQRALDERMLSFDVWGTRAHVVMLAESKIIPSDRAASILSALEKIDQRIALGNFSVDPERGAQLTLEKEVVALAGESAGLSMHTARSRNDQVMVTEMLYLREQVLQLGELIGRSIESLLRHADAHLTTAMPGYTHMQPAKPTTFAHWSLAYAAALLRQLSEMRSLLELYDMNPLGAVESYGTSWPIDRERTAELLGFSRVWEVPQDAISQRGVFQLKVLGSFAQSAMVVSRMATDLMLYSTFEYGFVSFGSGVSQRLHPITGSSVMAQKKNPDALELLRACAPQMVGLYQAAFGLLSGLPSGYNRDSREVKEYMMLGCDKLAAAFSSLCTVIDGIVLNAERMHDLIDSNYSLTTDLADYLAQRCELPYRLVYKVVGQAVDEIIERGQSLRSISIAQLNKIAQRYEIAFQVDDTAVQDALNPEIALARRAHQGGTNPEVTAQLVLQSRAALEESSKWIAEWWQRINRARAEAKAQAQALMKGTAQSKSA